MHESSGPPRGAYVQGRANFYCLDVSLVRRRAAGSGLDARVPEPRMPEVDRVRRVRDGCAADRSPFAASRRVSWAGSPDLKYPFTSKTTSGRGCAVVLNRDPVEARRARGQPTNYSPESFQR